MQVHPRDEHEELLGSRYARLLTCEIGFVLRRLRIDSCRRAGTLEATDLLLISCGPILPDRKPLVPDEALYTFQVADGYRIEWSAARLMNQPLRSSGACYEEHGHKLEKLFCSWLVSKTEAAGARPRLPTWSEKGPRRMLHEFHLSAAPC